MAKYYDRGAINHTYRSYNYFELTTISSDKLILLGKSRIGICFGVPKTISFQNLVSRIFVSYENNPNILLLGEVVRIICFIRVVIKFEYLLFLTREKINDLI